MKRFLERGLLWVKYWWYRDKVQEAREAMDSIEGNSMAPQGTMVWFWPFESKRQAKERWRDTHRDSHTRLAEVRSQLDLPPLTNEVVAASQVPTDEIVPAPDSLDTTPTP